jgi:diadenosine tetraphosphate (Ap4A) HIT family hydrolase
VAKARPADAPDAPGCGICGLIARIRAGTFDDFVAELPNCYVTLGDAQFYRGYCVLLAKRHATEMFLLPIADARALFDEMRLVAEAIAAVTCPWKINYECLGNVEPHVHWHLLPRFATDQLRHAPVWIRPEAERKVALADGDRRELIAALRKQISARLASARIARR